MISQNFETSEHSFLRNIEQFLKSSCEKKAYWFWINFIHSRLVICLTIPASCAIFIRITFDFILIILHHRMSWVKITRTLSSDFKPRENNYSQSFRTCFESSTSDLPYDIVSEFNIHTYIHTYHTHTYRYVCDPPCDML